MGKVQNENSKGKEKDKGDEEINRSFAQLEGKCCCCGKAGHKSPLFRDKNKPKDEWAINKAQQSHAHAASSDASVVGIWVCTDRTNNDTAEKRFEWRKSYRMGRSPHPDAVSPTSCGNAKLDHCWITI